MTMPDDYRRAEGVDAEDPPRRFSIPDLPTDDKREQRALSWRDPAFLVGLALGLAVLALALLGP